VRRRALPAGPEAQIAGDHDVVAAGDDLLLVADSSDGGGGEPLSS
jgi:hypothetical protein